ncbi:hypothetical protein [Cryobacterium sp. Hz9]|uniref:hypothetical protein n=1 Tax=Cryobacterium sp. Hz9 TaxID=1259167 RepID=UPI00106D72F7|nr:hypothetical protein [Cryobacterium sp. Hz9]TFB65032.1 hypothetical protein E3N85_12655 [Cryobacterium sp. Hz9]
MTMSNLSNEPSTDVKNLSTDKAFFLALLERLGDVIAASAEFGINRGSGYRWARSVGIRGPKPHPWARGVYGINAATADSERF